MPMDLHDLLERKYREYNQASFIAQDPISIPHRFSKQQDIEIAGFFAAILAWGTRTSIIRSTSAILEAMDGAPYDFVRHHQAIERKRLLHLKHRTFNATDLLYFVEWLQWHYQHHTSLETAFCPPQIDKPNMRERLIYFHKLFFSLEHPARTTKHIATPMRKSACKRLNMYLRWMVRHDAQHVDFGLWQRIDTASLICPLDVHVARVSHKLGLIPQHKADWRMAETLTTALSTFDPIDPVRFDFALFGLGAEERIR